LTDSRRLLLVRVLHTLAWGVFAGAIIAILPAMLAGRQRLAIWISLLVWAEVAVLVLNRLRCPLTAVAARYTDDRAANFDIFLPLWLADWNKAIFGSLFAVTQFLLWCTTVFSAP
jgi:hypothetical protein